MKKKANFYLRLNKKALNELDHFLLKNNILWRKDKISWNFQRENLPFTPQGSLPLLIKNLVYFDTNYVLDILSIYKEYLCQKFIVCSKDPKENLYIETGTIWHFLFDKNNTSKIEEVERVAYFLYLEQLNPNEIDLNKNNALHVFLDNYCYFGILSEPILEKSFWKIFNFLLMLKTDINYINPELNLTPICHFQKIEMHTNYQSVLQKTWLNIKKYHIAPSSGYFIWRSFSYDLITHLDWAWNNFPKETEERFREILSYINLYTLRQNNIERNYTLERMRNFLAKKESKILLAQIKNEKILNKEML